MLFKLLGRTALIRALPRPAFRLPYRVESHQIHSGGFPFPRSPTYDAIARRFASDAPEDPGAYSFGEFQQEMIHDISPGQAFYPDEFDVLLTDINHRILGNVISEQLGIGYLSVPTDEDAKKTVQVVDGLIYGMNRRTIVPLVVSNGEQARWVFFIVDTGSPFTYISDKVGEVFNIQETTKVRNVSIGGHYKDVHLPHPASHFHDVSLLGTDFFSAHDVQVWNDYGKNEAKLRFSGGWKLSEGLGL